MRRVVVVARRMMLLIIGCASLCVGAILLYSAGPDTIAQAPMPFLLAILALILLPACTVALIELERRRRTRSAGLVWTSRDGRGLALARKRLATSIVSHRPTPRRTLHQPHAPKARRLANWRLNGLSALEQRAQRQDATSDERQRPTTAHHPDQKAKA